MKQQSAVHNNERCPRCKETIETMLKEIYGDVKRNYKFHVGVHPEDYKVSIFHNEIETIFSTLKAYRGYENFAHASSLPNVDFYIPNPGFILEFDESQHFTACRKEALLKYPSTLKIGFDPRKWIELCQNINARDNDPPYRDEQRAWYDTLRDFLPTIITQLDSTVRLYSRDYHWCDLDPNVQEDIEKFKILLGDAGNSNNKKLEFKIITQIDPNPSLARIIIADEWWDVDIVTSKRLLQEICNNWPRKQKVNCLITCGGFLNFDWPEGLDWSDIGDNKCPKNDSLHRLIAEAKKQCDLLIDDGLRKELNACADYITIGLDSYMESSSQTQPHIELVALINLKTKDFNWTGKSYPTISQESGLVRINDLKTHFVNSSFGKVMILGCHDLNMFSPRGNAVVKADWRKEIIEEIGQKVVEEEPRIVLQHPHSTDSTGIWTPAWNKLGDMTPTIAEYISAGRYYNKEGVRSDLDMVLRKTKKGSTIDFIVSIVE